MVRESFSLIGDKALLVGVVLIVTGPILVQTTVRSFLIREHGGMRQEGEDLRRREQGAGMTVLQIAALAAVAIGRTGGDDSGPEDPAASDAGTRDLTGGLDNAVLRLPGAGRGVGAAEIVVSSVGLPVMILLALRKVHEQDNERDQADERRQER